MLNGIGGRTVAEAKENLSHVEFVAWMEFRRKRGSLHPGMRMEAGFALIAAMVANAMGGDKTPIDYMPHVEAEPLEDSVENLAKLMRPAR